MNNEIVFLSTKGTEKKSRDPSGASQGSDFNDFFNNEVESQRKANGPFRPSSEQASSKNNKSMERARSNKGEENSEEANNFILAGRELPKLTLHERGLEVGRMILTPQTSSISNMSLSNFLRNQSVSSQNQPNGKSTDEELQFQKNGRSGVQEISGSGTGPSNQVDSFTKETLDLKKERNELLQPGVMQNAGRDLRESEIDKDVQKKLSSGEKFSNIKTQPNLNLNNPVFESFERQLNSRLALVNSTISEQKQTGIGALTEKVTGSSQWRAVLKDGAQGHQRKFQPDQTQTEVDSAIKNDGELQKKKIFLKSEDYLAGGSAKAVDQINNKLMKDIHQKTSGEIQIREDRPDPSESAEKLTTTSKTKLSVALQEAQHLSAREVTTISENRPENRSLFRDITSNFQTLQQNHLENVIQKFSEALGSRMINAVQQNNWNLQLKLNPASLGEINVALEFNEGNLEGKLYAADETTRALLQESLSRLKQGLKEGLENYQSVDVFIGDRPQNRDHRDDSKDLNNQALEIDLGEEITSKTYLAELISTGRVDIQV